MRLKQKYKVVPDIPVASMADIAMLLLIFFVVCGKQSVQSKLAVDPPLSLTSEELSNATRLVVTVNANGETYLDGRMVDTKELLDELEAIMQNRTDRPSRTVLIEVDRRTAYKDYIVAVDAVNRVKGYVELRVKQ